MLSTLAISAVLGYSVQHRPIDVRARPRPGPARARRRLHPRQRMRRHGGDRGAAQGASARGPLARADVQPGRSRARHAAERARHRPEPELPDGVAAVRPAVVGLCRRAAAVVGAGDAARPRARRADPPAVTIWFHQHWTSSGPTAAARGRRPPLRAARGPAASTTTRGSPARAANWQSHLPDGEVSFTVELPAGALSPAAVARQVRAVLTSPALTSGRRGLTPDTSRSEATIP